jgi:hypothetical protein
MMRRFRLNGIMQPEELESKVEFPENADPSNVQRVPPWLRRRLNPNGWILLFIAAVAWVANYLHFTSFGIYEDDWYFLGFPSFVGYKTWMLGSMVDMFVRLKAMGRPVQMISDYTLSGLGALTNSLSVVYLIAYVLFAASALMMYMVVRQRFSRLVAALAATVFVLTPLDTLHQFPNGQFTVGPAFICIFAAMLLYLRGHRLWAYALAAVSILCYESIFFLFLGVPLLSNENIPSRRRREWLIHVGVGTALVAFYFLLRILSGEARATGMAKGAALIGSVLSCWVFNIFASFCTYVHAAVRAGEANIEAWLYGSLFFLVVAGWLTIAGSQRLSDSNKEGLPESSPLLRNIGTAVLFIVLGYPLSYFFFKTAPRLYMSDRDTRVSCAASFGSSILFAVLLAALFQSAKTRTARLFAALGVAGFLTVLFLYSFVIQQDYVDDWAEQREYARQMVSLTPDIEPDSAIIFKLKVPGDTSAVFDRTARGMGDEKYMYEQEFGWMCATGHAWPQILVVYSDDWVHHLKRDADGFMVWTEPTFDGRWAPASGRFRPGRFVVLEEKEPGVIVRRSQQITADGQQIVQLPPSEARKASLWASMSQNYVVRSFFPETVWKSEAKAVEKNPQLISPAHGAVLGASPTTFTWAPLPGAEDYWIDVGTAEAKGDIFAGFTQGKTQVAVDLAKRLNGGTIYVQLYSKYPGAQTVPGTGSNYQFRTAKQAASPPASNTASMNPALISPADGAVLAGSPETFIWTAVPGAADYWIDVGTAEAKGDIFGGFTGGKTQVTVDLSGHLGDGTVHVQLYSKYAGIQIVPGTGSKYRFPVRKR